MLYELAQLARKFTVASIATLTAHATPLWTMDGIAEVIDFNRNANQAPDKDLING